jgi:hypothetical protein
VEDDILEERHNEDNTSTAEISVSQEKLIPIDEDPEDGQFGMLAKQST